MILVKAPRQLDPVLLEKLRSGGAGIIDSTRLKFLAVIDGKEFAIEATIWEVEFGLAEASGAITIHGVVPWEVSKLLIDPH